MGSMGSPSINIIDIRRDKSNKSLLEMMNESLNPKDGSPPSLTTLLLYDEKGLKLFEDITYVEDYYVTNAEIEALTKHADAIVARIPHGAKLVELGSGNLRKVNILLQALERAQKSVNYYALDLSYSELERTFEELDTSGYHYVSFNGLHGTYDDGFAWLSKPDNKAESTCLMTLGSSLGNFSREESAKFLAACKDVLQPGDLIFVGLDGCQDRNRVLAAYNDSKGITEQFYRNGLDHANKVIGCEVFKQNEWDIEWVYDNEDHKHQASYVCLADVQSQDYSFHAGQKILLEYAYKYSKTQEERLWRDAGLILQSSYGNSKNDYFIHVLSPSMVNLSLQPSVYASAPEPSLNDWQQLWNAWDTVTKAMVPREELMNKPIQLRNNLIFYLGHIPTFTDIHYTKATGAKPSDPAFYAEIFERGIDPDVDDPEKCHAHSKIPDEWPPLEDMLQYETRIRARVRASITSGDATSNRKLSRGLWLAFEHEALHLETFLYMLLQSQRVLPPPGQPIPDFKALAQDAASKRDANKWHNIPATDIQIGINDPDSDVHPDRYFGWDNEQPARKASAHSFEAQSRCISNGEYARFLEETKNSRLPASWISTSEKTASDGSNGNGHTGDHILNSKSEADAVGSQAFLHGKTVRTVYGPVPLALALDWPIMASYDELSGYAIWAGGRIPSYEEAQSLYQYAESQKAAPMNTANNLISAVNGHLLNDGVEESPPSLPCIPNVVKPGSKAPSPDDVFINLTNQNVGFAAWHPTPITGEGDRLRGQSDAGGLWEWTSSTLTAHEGFKAMELYPGYTADFFDDKHNICLGGSWATHPRIAGRKSFVNWYQRNYPYTWATARLVRDLK